MGYCTAATAISGAGREVWVCGGGVCGLVPLTDPMLPKRGVAERQPSWSRCRGRLGGLRAWHELFLHAVVLPMCGVGRLTGNPHSAGAMVGQMPGRLCSVVGGAPVSCVGLALGPFVSSVVADGRVCCIVSGPFVRPPRRSQRVWSRKAALARRRGGVAVLPRCIVSRKVACTEPVP